MSSPDIGRNTQKLLYIMLDGVGWLPEGFARVVTMRGAVGTG